MAGSSFFAGVAGLKNHQVRMDVIGNNIANVNTYGFKAGRATFADILSQTYRGASAPQGGRGGTNALQVGLGMSMFSIDNFMTQGVFETTGRATDLAVEGNGFFIVHDGESDLYTRSGNFSLDRDGLLVNPEGLKVMGWNHIALDSAGNPYVDVSGTVDELEILIGQKMEANATTNAFLRSNLDAGERTKSAVELGDRLIDIHDGDVQNVNHLGLRWGDFVQVAVSYVDANATEPAAADGSDVTPNSTAIRYFQIDNNTTMRDLQSWVQSVLEEADPSNIRNCVASVEDGLVKVVNSASTTDEAVRVSIRAVTGGDARADGGLNMRGYDEETIGEWDAVLGNTPFEEMASSRSVFNNAFSSADVAIDYIGAGWGGAIGGELPRLIYAPTFRDVSDTDATPTWGYYASAPGSSREAEDSGESMQVLNGWEHLQSSYVHRAAINVYDSLGAAHQMQVSFYNIGQIYTAAGSWEGNSWRWKAEMDYNKDPYAFDTLSGHADPTNYLMFQDNGLLNTNYLTGSINFDASPTDADGLSTSSVEMNNITLNFGVRDDLINSVTQYNSESTAAIVRQDGYAMGVLESFYIDVRGDINGVFSNGLRQPLGKVALALFDNAEGLTKQGSNLWSASANSGLGRITQAHVGGAGGIFASTLEQSNVDLSQEFTNMIITQRGFQANARTITTSDEMLQELVNLKR